jgi:peptidoglycan/xylan/chitin deacetylase (PgdA/CDA1 family)
MSPEAAQTLVPRISSAMLRSFAGFASRRGRGTSLLILTYHRVTPSPDALLPDEPDARAFAALIDSIRSTFNVLPLGEALGLRTEGRLPARAVSITFDDGYSNNAEVALPILEQRGVRATFYVATGYLNGGRMWNDTVIEAVRRAPRLDLEDFGLGNHALAGVAERVTAIDRILRALKYREYDERLAIAAEIAHRAGLAAKSDLMMSDDQVRQLAEAGMEVGAHTVSHPILAGIDRTAAVREIEESKRRLEQIIGRSVSSFAYPNGQPGKDYGREHVEIVRSAGYVSAVTTAWGCVTSEAQQYELPRIAPWGATRFRYLLRIARSYFDRSHAVA